MLSLSQPFEQKDLGFTPITSQSENRSYFIDSLNPNPPKDTEGRREDSGRGWVRELQGRWPGVLG